MNRELIEINIDRIIIKSRLRKDNGDMATLESSIKKIGLLYPVIIDQNNILICGGRRIMACKNAGVSKIHAIKLNIDFNSMTSLDIQSDENLCRKPLTNNELEMQIQTKKSIITGKTTGHKTGILKWLKNLFSK